ncbi:hypothetical protein PCL_10995 [Purpureocillium lilacinum]|uniref:Uncharacterized protein n=1 Tax=Purpureocillium lilacinum TaxID=33203 RepID=A0A2U3ED14_PURLI|nr:hypothetical protein PCL_10995 [Purpureocillium lilacinum]
MGRDFQGQGPVVRNATMFRVLLAHRVIALRQACAIHIDARLRPLGNLETPPAVIARLGYRKGANFANFAAPSCYQAAAGFRIVVPAHAVAPMGSRCDGHHVRSLGWQYMLMHSNALGWATK